VHFCLWNVDILACFHWRSHISWPLTCFEGWYEGSDFPHSAPSERNRIVILILYWYNSWDIDRFFNTPLHVLYHQRPLVSNSVSGPQRPLVRNSVSGAAVSGRGDESGAITDADCEWGAVDRQARVGPIIRDQYRRTLHVFTCIHCLHTNISVSWC
jgi:hypothetical protein